MLLLFFVMAGLAVAFAPLPVPSITPQERAFQIDARQFACSPSEPNVNAGDKVIIQLVSKRSPMGNKFTPKTVRLVTARLAQGTASLQMI
ncbi:MAG TPA: hypothetical protein VK206_04845 [Anaerolineales bacterium]|nr:hypothetical protein [Anaerolineales bacterium]HLO30540.1 hypothetical protein [Anaerolineales bacterium]